MKNLVLILSCLLILLLQPLVKAQSAPFQLYLEPITIPDMPGLQSYAFGQHDGKYLFVGGRLDGLHRRQPTWSFDIAGHNTNLYVADFENHNLWSAGIGSLSAALQDQLSSTNMEFYQEGEYLYLFGGYGYSSLLADHNTFPYLAALHVPSVIEAIINGNPLSSHIRQITDSAFMVTGGRVDKIYDNFYLVGGQKFIGKYNPMGPTHGTGFTQEYTNQIRKFKIHDSGTVIYIEHLPYLTDTANLHRRDYNVVPQILPNNQEGLTAFSGVFQTGLDLPYLNCVNIDSSSYEVNNDFAQYYNHYHCANLGLYSSLKNEMHTVFFGGIAQYYEEADTLVQDNEVPFVRTIARVSRDSAGTMSEYKLPISMPSLLGAGSEFIPLLDLARYDNGVFKLDELPADTTLVGYVYGGIESTAPNIFFINDGTQSSASNQLFKVFLYQSSAISLDQLNVHSQNGLNIQVHPNPSRHELYVFMDLENSTNLNLRILDVNGKLVQEFEQFLSMGPQRIFLDLDKQMRSGTYLLQIETKNQQSIIKWILQP